jgi:hypothetical protein
MPLYPEVLWTKEHTPIPSPSVVFTFGLIVESIKELGGASPGSSFDQNLCYKYLNGSCEPILDIYVPRAFQWYNEIFNPMSFDPLPSKNLKVHWDSNSQSESSLGSAGVHSFTLSYIPESMKCYSCTSLLAQIFANLCLSRKPKVRVVTTNEWWKYLHSKMPMSANQGDL